MFVVAIAILLIFISVYSKSLIGNEKSEQRLTFIAIVFCLTFIAATQSIEKAPVDDLINYRNSFLNLRGISYKTLWSQYLNGDIKDFGFFAFSKIFADIGISANFWMGILGFCFATAFAYIVCKYAKEKFVAVVALFALVFSFTLTGLRQTMALCFVLFSYRWIIEKKPIRFIITVLIATFFHSTALVFLPAYFIAKLKIGKKQFAFMIISLVIAIALPSLIRSMVSIFAWNEFIKGYEDRTAALTWSSYIINFAIYLFCFVFKNKTEQNTKQSLPVLDVLMNCSAIGICFLAFSTVIAEAFRAAYYYNICSGVMVANVISETENTDNQKIMYVAVVIAFLAYMFITGTYSSFVFVWQ